MSFIFSPSNMMDYRGCPRRFQGRYITKEIPYKESPQMKRGTAVHEKIETALQKGPQSVTWDDPALHMDYIYKRLSTVQALRALGCELLVEKQMILDKEGKVLTDWFDDKAYFRARADIILLPPEGGDQMSIIDIKTGKKWDDDEFQLRAYAYLASKHWDVKRINYSYWYVDQGKSVQGYVDASNRMERHGSIRAILDEMDKAIQNNDFPCKQNKNCRWCQFYKDREKCTIQR